MAELSLLRCCITCDRCLEVPRVEFSASSASAHNRWIKNYYGYVFPHIRRIIFKFFSLICFYPFLRNNFYSQHHFSRIEFSYLHSLFSTSPSTARHHSSPLHLRLPSHVLCITFWNSWGRRPYFKLLFLLFTYNRSLSYRLPNSNFSTMGITRSNSAAVYSPIYVSPTSTLGILIFVVNTCFVPRITGKSSRNYEPGNKQDHKISALDTD